MKSIVRYIYLLLAVAVAVSCYRKPLYDECVCDNTLSIPISVDWSVSGVSPQNVTVLFYDSEDETLQYEHKYEHNEEDIQSYVKLPIGSYTAVVFNELRNQIDYVSCVGHEDFSTLKFESNDDDPLRSRSTTRSYVEQPGDLAVAIIEDVVVTEDMIVEAASLADQNVDTRTLSDTTRATVESLVGVVPKKKSATIVITAHVNNIYYARMPALVDLVNLADGYYVFGDKNSTTPSTLQFSMNNRTYDSTTPQRDGTISATITTFGTLSDRLSTTGHDATTPIMLDILFQLIDEDYTETSLAVDVTNDITISERSDGSVLMTIDVDIDESLPEVTPEGSDDSGFGSAVLDWGEIDVPLTFK